MVCEVNRARADMVINESIVCIFVDVMLMMMMQLDNN